MATFAFAPDDVVVSTSEAVSREVRAGLTAKPKTLSPWLFYDETGSHLFEQITELPEYYLTRTERAIFATHAEEILREAASTDGPHPAGKLTLIELGAGTATKTGILLAEAVRQQGSVVYQPVDVRDGARRGQREYLEEYSRRHRPPPGADYTREALPLNRLPNTRTLALYIGSSIGNFTPADAREVLRNLRAQLLPGDTLLLGTDLAPIAGAGDHKSEAMLLAAYDDAAGITARLQSQRSHPAESRPRYGLRRRDRFRHKVLWNPAESRIEMHLESLTAQRVHLPADDFGPAMTFGFAAGETIHTENSYKFTPAKVEALLASANFKATKSGRIRSICSP